jgi:hypothetical protein
MGNDGLWEQVVELDGGNTAQRAGCSYCEAEKLYTIGLLNKECVVDLTNRRVASADGFSRVSYGQELCVLAYLIGAKDVPVAGRLTPGESLPDGQFFFRGPHKLPTAKLEKAFGEFPERLYESEEQFGAKRCEYGDASLELYVLPRVPLTVVVWASDEEFGPRASILFDETAGVQMPLDALWMAANIAVKALVKAGEADNKKARLGQEI